MMMHNNFGRDAFRIFPCQGRVWAVSQVRDPFEQLRGTLGGAREPPEVGGALKRDTDEIVMRSIAVR